MYLENFAKEVDPRYAINNVKPRHNLGLKETF